MSTVDQPDYQAGVASAQVLLASVAGGISHAKVGIPVNAETIIVIASQNVYPPSVVTAVGVTTGLLYTSQAAFAPGEPAVATWFFDVTSVLDSQLNVDWSVTPTNQWFVYADYGVHIVADASKQTNLLGQQYVIATVPGVDTLDHPTNELTCSSAAFTGSGTLLAAPGSGMRYRIFASQISVITGTLAGALTDSISSAAFALGAAVGAASLQYGPSGLALSNDAGVNFTLESGSGTTSALVIHTTETI